MKNFFSIGNVEQVVRFDRSGTTFIVGENLDEGGSSGAGKSTIIQALAFALFDKITTKVKKERMINYINDSKKTQMYVELEFKIGETDWKIRRERGINTEPTLWENGVVVTTAAKLNQKLEAILGFSYEMFKQVIFFNGKSLPFLDQEVSDQRNFMEELLKITILSRKAEFLKQEIKDTNDAIKIQLALVEQQKSINKQLQEKIDTTALKADQWESSREAEVKKFEAELAIIKELKLPCTEEELTELATLKADILALENAIKDIQRDKLSGEKLVQKLEQEHKHLDDKQCPYCMQAFTSVEKLSEVLKSISTESEKLSSIDQELTPLLAELKPFKDRYAELSLRVDPREQARIKLLIQSGPVLEQKLTAKREAINPYMSALEALSQEALRDVDTSEIDKLKTLAAHQSILLKLLTDKNSYIRKGIIAKSLPFLNKRIDSYVTALGLPHIVLFQPDMSVAITKQGRELDHGNLSNGEKVRLNFSLCLAFRDTLDFLKSKVNLLMTDEIDGGALDEQAVNNMIGLLKRKAWDDKLEVLIISHRPEFDGRCDRTLIVRKKNGFSTIIEGAS